MTRRKRHNKRKGRGPSASVDVEYEAAGESVPDAEPTDAADAPSGLALHLVIAKRLALVVVVHVSCLLLALIVAAQHSPLAKLAGFDVLALPGAETTLRAKLELDGPAFFNPDVEGVRLQFVDLGIKDHFIDLSKDDPTRYAGEVVGEAVTDDDGTASVTVTAPLEAGCHVYQVRLADPDALALRNRLVPLVLASTPADQPIIVTDIDNTICQTRLAATIADDPRDVAPLPDAADVLKEESETHRIVYLTARPSALSHRTRNWLATHGFPAGPVFLRELDHEARRGRFTEAGYKEAFLRDTIRATWPKVPWGIGNIEGDARAYLAAGIRPILIAPENDINDASTQGTERVPDWKVVRKLLEESP